MIKKYEVSEIDCAVCAGKIENAIKEFTMRENYIIIGINL